VVKIPSARRAPGDAVLLARHFTRRFARELNPRSRSPASPRRGRRDRRLRLARQRPRAREPHQARGHHGRRQAARRARPRPARRGCRRSADAINLRAAREVADRRAIHQALSRTDNNISGAAKLLGISRPTLYDLLKQYQPPYVPLVERLEGERRAKWLGMKAAGPRVIMDWIDRQPDWRAAMSILGIASRLDDLTMSGGVETRLRADFKTAKKPIEALEQGKDVLAKLNALPPAVQRRLLLGALDLIGQPSQTGSYMTMITRWARGEDVTGSIESSLPSELRETLLDQRNAAWVPEVRKHLGPPGTRLIVVGAGHLAGRNNLIELLTAAGMKPVRYSRTGPPLPRPAFTPQPTRLTDCFSYLAAPPAPPPPPPPPRAQ
jgi:hypothetical protein